MNEAASSRSSDWPPLPRLRRRVSSSTWFARGAVVAARAPGRLDVMGGIADYSGSLVCEMPLAEATAAAVQRRKDGQVICISAQAKEPVRVDAKQLGDPDPLALREHLAGEAAWARYPLGCAWWLVCHAQPRQWQGGLTVQIDSDVPLGGGVSSSAAIEVATMTALAALWEVPLSSLQLSAACQVVENRVAGAPCGVMDQVTSCMGQPGSLLEILCQPGVDGLPAQVLGTLAIPRGYAFVGIHSGVTHEVSGDPYTDTRVAAFMGQKILSQLRTPDLTDGWLARVDADQFTDELAAQLPEVIDGQTFLDRFGLTNDPVTTVQPQRTYHVRAATTHHVLEMRRVSEFVALLKEDGGDLARRIVQAGQRMYASHRSYSDCANLGHPLTDRLVEMVRRIGPEGGLFGAKITGGGSGGTVAVLMRDDAQARQAVRVIRRQYTKQTGRPTQYFEGTSPGAAVLGAMPWTIPNDHNHNHDHDNDKEPTR